MFFQILATLKVYRTKSGSLRRVHSKRNGRYGLWRLPNRNGERKVKGFRSTVNGLWSIAK